MGKKVFKIGIKRKKGYLYYIDDDGDVSRLNIEKDTRITNYIDDFYEALASEGIELEALDNNLISNLEEAIYKACTQKVGKVGLKRQEGYFYYIDKEGDISRKRLSKKAKRYG